MPIPLIKPTQQSGQSGMSSPVYQQPGPRSSFGQLSTQLNNQQQVMGGAKPGRGSQSSQTRIPPFVASTQPYTPPMAPALFPKASASLNDGVTLGWQGSLDQQVEDSLRTVGNLQQGIDIYTKAGMPPDLASDKAFEIWGRLDKTSSLGGRPKNYVNSSQQGPDPYSQIGY